MLCTTACDSLLLSVPKEDLGEVAEGCLSSWQTGCLTQLIHSRPVDLHAKHTISLVLYQIIWTLWQLNDLHSGNNWEVNHRNTEVRRVLCRSPSPNVLLRAGSHWECCSGSHPVGFCISLRAETPKPPRATNSSVSPPSQWAFSYV